MKIPVKVNHSSRIINTEKFDEREAWLKLVVKIISWKDGVSEGGNFKITNKITPKEWKTYYNRTLKTNTSYKREKILSQLKETKEIIAIHGGFE